MKIEETTRGEMKHNGNIEFNSALMKDLRQELGMMGTEIRDWCFERIQIISPKRFHNIKQGQTTLNGVLL